MEASNKQRTAIAALALSAAGFVGIITREGYTDNAIIPTKGDKPTNGFGMTEGVKMGDKTNPVQAAQRSLSFIQKQEGAIKQCVTAPLNQGEYDVYVDLAYNIGAARFCGSTIVKRINAQDYSGACQSILLYKYAAGYDC